MTTVAFKSNSKDVIAVQTDRLCKRFKSTLIFLYFASNEPGFLF